MEDTPIGPWTQYSTRLTPLTTPLLLQTPADKLDISFMNPTKVLSMAVTITTATTVAAAVLALDWRPTYGSNTGRLERKTLTIPIGTAVGKVVFSTPINAMFMPGEQLMIELITAATAGAGHVDLWIEPTWESPLNGPNSLQSV